MAGVNTNWEELQVVLSFYGFQKAVATVFWEFQKLKILWSTLFVAIFPKFSFLK